jgi:WD40 repeat protein/serine/threonine protein kinase/two-component SAPR family response regulator
LESILKQTQMAQLEIRLFGPFQVKLVGATPSGFDSDKVRALLAYLAMEGGRPHRREKLAGILWPEFTERSARTNLRRALANLRQVIGDHQANPPFLKITRQTIQFNSDSDAWVDADAFLKAVTPSSGRWPDFSELEEAVMWYRGAFLEGFSIPDGAAFEEWALVTRESLQRELLATLQRLTDHHQGLGGYEQALVHARRQVELEPYREEGQQQIMRLLALSGRRSEALAHYEAFQQLMAQDLAVEPTAGMRALYERIRDGELARDHARFGQRKVKGYELRERLGVGNFGEVYRAYQPMVGRDVAIKIIRPHFANHPDFIRRFETEAQLVARLEHPHIVPLYDYWREPDGAFLVMRWLRGDSLQQALQRGPWNLAPAVQLVQQVAAALHTAHRQGIIHRDIKPANILLDDEGNAYLSDFGVATLVGPLDTPEQNPPAEMAGDPSGSLGYLSPESIQQGPVTAATDIYSLGVVIYELLTAQHPFPGCHGQELLDKHLHEPIPGARVLRPELPPAVDEVIQQATAKDPQDRYADVLELAAALQGAVADTPQPVLAPVDAAAFQNPYKGLRSFQEADAADFFGRNALVERLLSRIREDGAGSRFLALVGPSGSGKSSTIGAGLLPLLRSGAITGSDNWFIAQMVPGRHPLDELEIALLRIAVSQPSGLMEQLRRDERGLLRAASLALPDEGSEFLLIIDQFEEIFTLATDTNESIKLLQLLVAAVTDPRSQVRVLISLRADFYDRPLTHIEFGRLVRARTEVVVPMDAEEMSQAINEPAVRAGAQLEPELMTKMVADVGDQPGALPLLQYALTELFERRDGQRLTLAAYHEMGGVLGALGRRAEEIYQSLDKVEQDMTRQLFLRLVALGEGVEDTRRRVLRSELEALQPAAETDIDDSPFTSPLDSVLNTFGRNRLLTFDRDPTTRGPTVEVAHEALLREWERLRGWLDESRNDIRQERVVSRAAEEWEQHNRDESFLLHGARLEQFEKWRATSTLIQTPLVQGYISQSLLQRDKDQQVEAKRKAREVQLERRSKLFLRGLVAVFALATLVSVGLLFIAIGERQSALASAAEAQNVALISGSQAALANHDTDTALALAWQAVALNPGSAIAQAQLSEAAYAPGTVRMLTGHEDIINRIVISPDGRTVFGGASDGTVILWDIETGQILWRGQAYTPEETEEQAYKLEVNAGAFSPDGQVVAASFDDRIMFWDTTDGQLIRQIESAALDQKIVISPTGDQFATIGKEKKGHLVFWDFASGEAIREFDRGSEIEDIEYAAEGSLILIASTTGVLTLLDAQTGQVIYEVEADLGTSAGALFSVALSPDGTRVAADFSTAGVLIWHLETGDLLQDFRYEGGAFVVAFHPVDGTILTGGQGVLQTINSQTGEVLRANTSQSGAIFHLAITPDGKRAVTTALDGVVRVWDLQAGQVIRRYPVPKANLFEVALSPDARTLLVGKVDGTVTLFDVESGEEIRRLVDDQPIMAVTFSPDGRKALIGAGYRLAQKVESGHIILWDVETGEEIRRFEGHPYAVFDVEFSPDGSLAVSAGNGAMAILWDVEAGKELHRFEDYWENNIYADKSFWDVKFSPDGSKIFASHASGPIIVWDVESGEEIQQLVGHNGGTSIVFSNDGQRLVSGGADSQVILWDVQTGNMLRRFSNHAGGVGQVRFSPDETLLLGGGADGTGSLWRVETGEAIRRYGGGYVFSPNFSPDGRHAVVGFRDGTVELWRIDSTIDELLTWTRNNRYIPELTCEQRELYRVEPLCDEAVEQ